MLTAMGMAAGAAAGVWLLVRAAELAAWVMFALAAALLAGVRGTACLAGWTTGAVDALLGPTVRPRA